MHEQFEEYKTAFIEETEEHLDLLNDNLIVLEKDHANSSLIDGIFRVLHTLKSSAAAVGYNDLGQFAHRAEDLVQQIRSHEKKITPKIVNILFQVFDDIKEYILRIKGGSPDDRLFEKTEKLLIPFERREKTTAMLQDAGQQMFEEKETDLPEAVLNFMNRNENSRLYEIRIVIDPAEPIQWLRAELVMSHALKIGEIVHSVPAKSEFQSGHFNGELTLYVTTKKTVPELLKRLSIDLVRIPVCRRIGTDPESAPESMLPQGRNESSPSQKTGMGSSSVRVPIKKLDSIMHLVGELVVANSSLKLLEKKIKDLHRDSPVSNEMSLITDKLTKLSTTLQSSILKTRMLPIRTLLNPYHRIVRDLSLKESKEIDLMIRGEETELDKKVIDSIGDSITHLIRNAVDHGIESPAERIRKNKSRRGTIELTASQAGNHIVITVRDDGQGLDPEKLREAAVTEGYLEPEQARNMPDSELIDLIFQPGFSTSEKVSSVSGRGVGLDVVHTVISSLNGNVQIDSTQGTGTEFIITLPLTLAVSMVIMVEAGQKSYGIPIGDVQETIKVPEQILRNRQYVQTMNWANRIIPVIGLSHILEGKSGCLPVDIYGNVPVVIIRYRDRELGLIVDRIAGKQEIVMKPLEEHYRTVRGLSGAAILGDGSILLITDIIGLLQIVREIEEKEKKSNPAVKENVQ